MRLSEVRQLDSVDQLRPADGVSQLDPEMKMPAGEVHVSRAASVCPRDWLGLTSTAAPGKTSRSACSRPRYSSPILAASMFPQTYLFPNQETQQSLETLEPNGTIRAFPGSPLGTLAHVLSGLGDKSGDKSGALPRRPRSSPDRPTQTQVRAFHGSPGR